MHAQPNRRTQNLIISSNCYRVAAQPSKYACIDVISLWSMHQLFIVDAQTTRDTEPMHRVEFVEFTHGSAVATPRPHNRYAPFYLKKIT